MKLSIKWNVVELRVRSQLATISNVINDVIWTCVATDDENHEQTYSVQGETILGLPDSSAYTKFEDLDEPMLISWVHTALGLDKVRAIEFESKTKCLDKYHPLAQIVVPSWRK